MELSDSEASKIDAYTDFVIIQESELDIEMPDSGQEDPDLNGATYASEPPDPTPNVGSRSLRNKGQSMKGSGLSKRIPLQFWAERVTTWTLAMISLVPSLSLPNYQQNENNIYPYYFVNTEDPGAGVRVYDLDTGLNMEHPEFDGRLKPGITRGRTRNDWDIDWLFPRVDTEEYIWVSDGQGRMFKQPYEFSYIDPQTPQILMAGSIQPTQTFD